MLTTMVYRWWKIFKLHWLKCSKTVLNRNLGQKKNDLGPLIWIFLSITIINFRFSGRVLRPTKTSNEDHSFYNKVSLKKQHSFSESQLTEHYKRYTSATQPNFQANCFCLVSDKTLALLWVHCTISRCSKNAFLKHLESKCLCILVKLHKEILIPVTEDFYLFGWV